MNQQTRKKFEFVYDLPYAERMELCKILDLTDKWEFLASLMGYDVLSIRTFRRARQSPTDELLTEWGHRNGTILNLFGHLYTMKHYQAMTALKKFVDPEYHRLIYEGEGVLLFQRLTERKPSISAEENINFDQTNSCNNLPSKMQGIRLTTSQTESKIINVCNESPVARANVPVSQASTLPVNKENENRQSPEDNENRHSPECNKNKDSLDAFGLEFGPPKIKYKELELATNGWDKATVLGKGGFGIVYKAIWKNTPVAVKKTLAKDSDGTLSVPMQQILAELTMLNSCRHDSILPLYGYSVDGEFPCLIYQFMPNGSLEDRLLCRQGTAPLTWLQRLRIATETARGLQWLHTIKDPPLVHGDIKSANILLDSNFQPKIGDFGLAREGPNSQYTHMKISRIHGTRPYLPDEFLRGKKLSTKVDTHCFGIVLFELATGMRPYYEEKYLRDLIEQTDEAQLPNLIDRKALPRDETIYELLIDLGKKCVAHRAKDRPEMVNVLKKLDEALALRNNAQQSVPAVGPRSFSPLELQRHYDVIGQQRMALAQLPVSHTQENRTLAVSPNSNLQGKPSSRVPVSNARAVLGLEAVSKPDEMSSPMQGDATPDLDNVRRIPAENSIIPATISGSPRIAVTPATDSTTASQVSSFQSSESIIPSEDIDNISEQSSEPSQFTFEGSFNIPNFAALGIGPEASDIGTVEGTARNSGPIPTSAKGKTLLI